MHNLSARPRTRLTAVLAVPLSVGLLAACGSQPADHAASSTPPATSSTGSMTPGPATPSSTSSASSSTSSTSSETSQLEEAEGATPLVSPTSSTSSSSTSSTSTSTPSADESSSSSTSSPTQSPAADEDQQSSTAPEGTYGSSVLKSGSSGQAVLAVQRRLSNLGYWGTSPDGSYGGSTRQAVLALQKAAGISRTGKVDAATRRALTQGVFPRSRTGASKALEIDLDRQIVLAVEGGKVKAVINASSGNGETFVVKDKKTGKETEYHARTKRGSFSVYAEDNKLHESTLELGSMWRPKYFNGAIAVHGSGSVPAYPASHGCVRVSNSAMNWIWDSWGLPIGTTVKVY